MRAKHGKFEVRDGKNRRKETEKGEKQKFERLTRKKFEIYIKAESRSDFYYLL